MVLRSLRERVYQTLFFEAGGFVIVTPCYAFFSGSDMPGSAGLIATLAIAMMVWSPVHNTLFDIADAWLTGRVASDRRTGLRLAHAASHEVSAMIVTLPLVMGLGGYTLRDALMVEIGLTLAYTAWAYVFHRVYDRARPVVRKTASLSYAAALPQGDAAQ